MTRTHGMIIGLSSALLTTLSAACLSTSDDPGSIAEGDKGYEVLGVEGLAAVKFSPQAAGERQLQTSGAMQDSLAGVAATCPVQPASLCGSNTPVDLSQLTPAAQQALVEALTAKERLYAQGTYSVELRDDGTQVVSFRLSDLYVEAAASYEFSSWVIDTPLGIVTTTSAGAARAGGYRGLHVDDLAQAIANPTEMCRKEFVDGEGYFVAETEVPCRYLFPYCGVELADAPLGEYYIVQRGYVTYGPDSSGHTHREFLDVAVNIFVSALP